MLFCYTPHMKPKVVAIVGSTASGKTSLSIALAKQFKGEVVSADSRQVYRGFDLGSGKVTEEEMGGVPHHLLDVADPTTVYTANNFVQDAVKAINGILAQHHLPIIAGGTFFYLDALLGRISSPEVPPNQTLRLELEQLSREQLNDRLRVLDPIRLKNIDTKNSRRLIRAIEIASTLGHVPVGAPAERYACLTLGLKIDPATLQHNIHVRLMVRLEAGMLDEVRTLLASGVSHERLESLGLEYRYCARHLRGLISYDEMAAQIEIKTRQFAKRQMTWLKRDQSIVWVDKNDLESIIDLVGNFLNN